MVDGILNINKDLHMTSHDVVAKIRKLLKQKRVGHTGTLDPEASGVLPICVGQATRVAEYLSESGKAYQATITFGTVTDTYDAEGVVVRTADISALTLEQIEAALPHFQGAQQQLPPRYSAIKIQGQPAYKLARAGAEITLEPRPIEIHTLEILGWEKPHLTLAVSCSKGTYIRSLAYDLGEYLGFGAYLTGLIRTRSGPFVLAESVTLAQLASAQEQNNLQQYLFPADFALQNYPALHLDEALTQRVMHGNAFAYADPTIAEQAEMGRVYGSNGQFLAIANWDAELQLWKPRKVLV
ncbi:tRNA pseudouridine(55) synthase TruB [Dictyobacter kobayashii]|uniref:tRNA pseudouridine synthase B n=1 Tax=Dictyobacter kobayashii TaxID=2014872 RepID=A0A402AMK5_9CHLR|nr:tRNA pseudouridine(55) synthase TruB [Dictyobacter kobayashii]GCE20230.1 tRNA pseudouridine synthase B [Dictyobacter kobayashii]